MSATGSLESALTKHVVYLQRYSAGLNNKERELFINLGKQSAAILKTELTTFSKTRLTAINKQLSALIDKTFNAYDKSVQAAFAELAEYEGSFQLAAMQNVMLPTLAAVPLPRLEALINDTQMSLVSGKDVKKMTIQQMLEDFQDATKTKTAQTIKSLIDIGVANGDSIDAISRKVAKEVSNQMSRPNGLVQTWSKTNILTAVNHISQTARNSIASANKKYIDWEKWSSVLDGRTSFVCQGRDAKRYEVDKGPYPPAHMRCRSVRLPYIPEEYAIIKQSERASEFGPVDSRTTYNSWLKRQNAEFQNDVLGPERAELFRSGKVRVDKFTDQEGKTLTLAQLRAKEGITLG